MTRWITLSKFLISRPVLSPLSIPVSIPVSKLRFFSQARIQSSVDLENLDKTQLSLLAEKCIVVSENDEVLGSGTKKECHLWENIETKKLLHRAFSVVLFNSKDELLVQRRSSAKITYPLHYTNTCCSHPLFSESEMTSDDALGVKRAAQRRLNYELGIPLEQAPPDAMTLMARVHYVARNHPDTMWGEHEIDYILVMKRDVDLTPNDNEVREAVYVDRDRLRAMLSSSADPVTPWFRLLCEREDGLLFKWWDHVDGLEKLINLDIRDWTR